MSKRYLGGYITSNFDPLGFTTQTIIQSGITVVAPASTSVVVNLLAGMSAGNIVIAFLGSAEDRTFTWPAGWTELVDAMAGTSSAMTIGYKIIDGTEGSSITLTASSAVTNATSIVVEVKTDVKSLEAATVQTTVNTTSVDPNAMTPLTGFSRYLFFACYGGAVRASSVTVSSFPTGYTKLQEYIDATSLKVNDGRILQNRRNYF